MEYIVFFSIYDYEMNIFKRFKILYITFLFRYILKSKYFVLLFKGIVIF